MGEYIMKKEILVGHHITGQTNLIFLKKRLERFKVS